MKNKICVLLSLFSLITPQIYAKQIQQKDDFISLAYVALYQLKFNQIDVKDVPKELDRYNWNGISDVAIIGGVYLAGKDGSLVTRWNESTWPEPYKGIDYKGAPINEDKKRATLCSKEVTEVAFDYFKKKGMKMWLSQSVAGWMEGGSLGIVCENDKLRKEYGDRLDSLARSLGCIGVDFDWEFPYTESQGIGYRKLMGEMKARGLKVSVCAIRPTIGKNYEDACIEVGADINGHVSKHMKWEEIIDNQLVDHINVMQYLGYNPETREMDINVKKEKMKEWEVCYPNEFKEGRHIKMLSGIGYYPYLIPAKATKDSPKHKMLPQIYKEFGKDGLKKRVVEEYTFWTCDDVRKMVRNAKKAGWSGVFTWLVTQDITVDMPQKYSRQQALGEEVKKIWKK